MKIDKQRLLSFAIRCTMIWVYIYTRTYYDISNIEIIQYIVYLVKTYQRFWFIFIWLYILRPLFLFPVTLLSIISWALFPIPIAIGINLIGENISASIGFFISRYFTKNWSKSTNKNIIESFRKKFPIHEAVIVGISRLSFFPDDVLNYGRWATKISYKNYIIWSIVGNFPFTMIYILFWSSIQNIENMTRSDLNIDKDILWLSIALYAIFIVIGIVISRQQKKKMTTPTN